MQIHYYAGPANRKQLDCTLTQQPNGNWRCLVLGGPEIIVVGNLPTAKAVLNSMARGS